MDESQAQYRDDDSARAPEHSTAQKEPPIVQPPLTASHFVEQVRSDTAGFVRSEFSHWIEDTLGSESYGAPRVFDLFTLLAITLAFALLFAIMKVMEPLLQTDLPLVILIVSLFLTFTAVAQAVLWGGTKPRLASIACGPIVWVMTFFFVALQSPTTFFTLTNIVGNGCLSILGFPIGYLAGGMVAGVFLLADIFRQRFMSGEDAPMPENDDAIFDQIDKDD